jgi:adenine-specific DNA-methyltransferase
LFEYEGRTHDPGLDKGNCWKHTARETDKGRSGMARMAEAGRLYVGRDQIRFRRYHDDFGRSEISAWWDGLGGAPDPIYVVQTNTKIIERCMLMATDPGDLVLDPTCGSGTTAYVAEQWGRRWITIDTSRVAVALARQRLLTAQFDYYALKNPDAGVDAGFEYKTAPHITSSVVANCHELDPIIDNHNRGEGSCAEVVDFAPDSPLEEGGFEPSVPLLRKALLGILNRDVRVSGSTSR